LVLGLRGWRISTLVACDLQLAGVGRWQLFSEVGAFAWPALYKYPPAVLLNDAIRKGQSEPGSLTDLLCRVEGVVYSCDVFRPNTNARILEINHNRRFHTPSLY